MWSRCDLIELLAIAHPITQGPMAGLATSALVVAVANAGGLGFFGCAGLTIDAIGDGVREIRAGVDWPYNLNFLIPHDEAPDAEAVVRMRARLALYYDELGLGAVPEPTADFPLFDAERLALILELRPPVVSFRFGLPDKAALRVIQKMGAHVLGSATIVGEARHLEAAGVSAIIAQGAEAGGHRATFMVPRDAGTIATLALVPQVVDAVRVPVIAAGGIADRRGIAAAFALGVSGVQIGTAFLICPEATTSLPYRRALLAHRGAGTHLTQSLSGHWARVVRNHFVAEMAAVEDQALPFLPQFCLTAPCHRTSVERDSSTSLGCGSSRRHRWRGLCRRTC